jgi:Uma2 family endonuclease
LIVNYPLHFNNNEYITFIESVRQILPNYTVEDYERWEGRWEIINGIAISMPPMPNPKHQNIAGKIFRIFDEAIENKGCTEYKVYQPIDYKISDDTIVNPDLLIVCKTIIGQYLDFSPSLVVEILSPSTALKDQNTKYDLYQNAGVKYYIILDPNQNSFEIYQLNSQGKYELVETANFDFDGCEINVDLKKCF